MSKSEPRDQTMGFYKADFQRTLYPLKTNLILLEHGVNDVKKFINRCLDREDYTVSFRSQTKVYAAKSRGHLRRTVKLDVVAEYFIYDIVYRNRSKFRKPHTTLKQHYGYRLEDGKPLPPSDSYKGYKGNLREQEATYKHRLDFDVASYFNSLYHHDVVSWFANLRASSDDYEALGQFLRECNSGRSLDCLPQGLYPTKMIGNDFLRFVEDFHGMKSDAITRFMDDVSLFSNDEDTIEADFYLVQKLLGSKGLTVNPAKTSREKNKGVDEQIDGVRS